MRSTIGSILILFLLSSSLHAAKFVVAGQTIGSKNALQVIQVDIEQGSFAEAAAKIEALLAEQAEAVVSTDDDVLLSVSDAIEQVIAPHRADLVAEYDKRFGAVAQGALAVVMQSPERDAGALYTIARRFPCSSVAEQALAAAARRSIELGDASAAIDLAALLSARGAKVDPTLLEPKALLNASPYAQPVPFDATWYGLIPSYNLIKAFPVRWDDRTILVGDRYVLAVRDNGQTAWTNSPPKPWVEQTRGDTPVDTGRGPIYAPVVYCGFQGEPLVILVRQPQTQNARGSVRAIRASDGKSLWSTENDSTLASVNFVGVPSLAGRIVYTMAIEQFARQSNLVVVAQDVSTGAVIWRRQLGTQMGQEIKDDWRARELEDFWRLGSIAVAGDRLVAAPNVGNVVCFDRFNGQMRWVKPYATPPIDIKLLRRFREARLANRTALPPIDNRQLTRFLSSTKVIGNAVVIAPQDAPIAIGLDLKTGKQLWHRELAETIVGTAGPLVIASGEVVMGIEAATGTTKWQYPATEGRITGPAVVTDRGVGVPTVNDAVWLSPQTGDVVRSTIEKFSFRKFMSTDAVKAALAGAGLTPSFGIPRESVTPEKR